MRTDPGKVFGIIVLFVATLLAMAGTILSTNLSVLDTDPASYVIVVMLMLLVFIFFSLKEDLHLNKRKRMVVYGIIVFIAYILLLSYMRVGLSSVFATFRIDALLIPISILSFILILFGTGGVKRLAPLLIYSLFMSPLLLMPVLLQNSAFANVNAAFVYDALKLFGAPVTLNGITITSLSNTSISIAATCAPIGTFIAIVMFLIPVAYLYRGALARRISWVLSGLALMLALNFARMFWISYSWAYYGIGQAIAIFHLFAGQVFFYAVIIVMILLAGWYGIHIERLAKGQLGTLAKDFSKKKSAFGYSWTIAIALGIIGMLFSMPYLDAVYASPSFFYSSLSAVGQNATYSAIAASFAEFSPNAIKVGEQNYTMALAILNGSNTTYVAAGAVNVPLPGVAATNYTRTVSTQSYLMMSGIRITSIVGYSGSKLLAVNYFAAPFNISGRYLSVDYEFIKLANVSVPSCGLLTYRSTGVFNYAESVIYNTLSGSFDYRTNGIMCDAYTAANYV